jgi:hypothetical protein
VGRAEDKDKLYRTQLDGLFDALDKQSLYDLARNIAKRVVFRLRLAEARLLSWSFVITAALALLLNYVALLFSFADMARNNGNFAFDGFSLWHAAWALFRELGFTGSQQIVSMSLFNTLWALLAFWLSRRILLRVMKADKVRWVALLLTVQAGVFVLAFLAMYASMYVSVLVYDSWYNTETQQYLLTQSIRMLYAFDRRLIGVLLVNAIVSCVPSAIFVILLVSLTLARIAPERVRTALQYLVYRFTTDKKPVLSQLATLSSWLVAFLTAIRGFIVEP